MNATDNGYNGYTITTEPGVIPRYVVRFDGEIISSHSRMADAVAMRDASAAAREAAPDNDFFVGYVECLYFADTGEGDQPPADAELSDDARAACLRDCEAFQRDNAELLAQAYAREYDEVQAGRDFYFTRNGHGVGYRDRRELRADGLGERLTRAAHDAGETFPYAGDDGLIYLE